MPDPERILLDTHALLWWQAGSNRLSRTARRVIEDAARAGVSPINIFETGLLLAKGRIALDRPLRTWTADLLADGHIDVVDVDLDVAAVGATLDDFHGDPADRMLYASALVSGRPLVTKDARIRRYAEKAGNVRTLW